MCVEHILHPPRCVRPHRSHSPTLGSTSSAYDSGSIRAEILCAAGASQIRRSCSPEISENASVIGCPVIAPLHDGSHRCVGFQRSRIHTDYLAFQQTLIGQHSQDPAEYLPGASLMSINRRVREMVE